MTKMVSTAFRIIEDFVRKYILFEEEEELDNETWPYFVEDDDDDDD